MQVWVKHIVIDQASNIYGDLNILSSGRYNSQVVSRFAFPCNVSNMNTVRLKKCHEENSPINIDNRYNLLLQKKRWENVLFPI
jgi:hypothetical protein